MSVKIAHEPENDRFVTRIDGRESRIEYAERGDILDLVSTFVHPDDRGRGVGERLVKRALEYAREHDRTVIPTCWFVGTVLERHPEYRDLVAEDAAETTA